jgi:hypothetical protein
MLNNFKITKIIYTLIIVLITSAAFADDLPPAFYNDVVVDNPTDATINDYIFEAIELGMFISFYGIQKKRQEKTVLNTNKKEK